MQNNALSWFEIPASDLDRAATFYGQVIGRALMHEQMGPQAMAVFPYQRGTGVGGCVMASAAMRPSDSGNVIYLSIEDSLDDALVRAEQAGGRVALGKTALPPGMGHYAHIIDSEGNRVGLHAA